MILAFHISQLQSITQAHTELIWPRSFREENRIVLQKPILHHQVNIRMSAYEKHSSQAGRKKNLLNPKQLKHSSRLFPFFSHPFRLQEVAEKKVYFALVIIAFKCLYYVQRHGTITERLHIHLTHLFSFLNVLLLKIGAILYAQATFSSRAKLKSAKGL